MANRKVSLKEIKRFANITWGDEEREVVADHPETAVTNPWMDESARFELDDIEAVKTWGLETVLDYCMKVAEKINEEENGMKIRIRYFTDGVQKLEKIGKGDWIDLRAAEDVEMKAGEHKLIPLGVAMQLPDGYEAHVVPRSSTFKNFGVLQANHVGIIDNSYCGDNDQWLFSAYAVRDTSIPKGSRICQFRIVEKQPELEFEEVDRLGNEDRGGFGSTGTI